MGSSFPLLDMCWTLDADHQPIPATSLEHWSECLNSDERIIHQEIVDGVQVSTVFLAIETALHHILLYGRPESVPPRLFETMIFGGPRSHEQIRYDTWDEALAGHVKIVEELKDA